MSDRNEPLEIMDEIDSKHKVTQNRTVYGPEWQSLRAALEAQAEELAHIEAELSAGQGDDDGDQILPDFREDATTSQKVGECLHLLEVRRDIIEAQRKTSQIKDEELIHLRVGGTGMTDETELRDLERRLAERQAKSDLSRFSNRYPDQPEASCEWRDLRGAIYVKDAVRYLDLRGLIERKPDAPSVVRVKGADHD